MAKKNRKNKEVGSFLEKILAFRSQIHPETERSILAVFFFAVSAVLILANFHNAGPAGEFIYDWLAKFFGLGYWLFPTIFLIMSGVFLSGNKEENDRSLGMTFLGGTLFIIAGLGLID